jgi:hypothetical protein
LEAVTGPDIINQRVGEKAMAELELPKAEMIIAILGVAEFLVAKTSSG